MPLLKFAWLAPLRGSAARSSLFLFGALAGAAAPTAPIEATPLVPPRAPRAATLFELVAPADSGVLTENRYADPQMWGQRYHEFEIGPIGSGVAIGDYDNDGRPDLFVVSKTESCRLFRNLGNWRFADVTEAAGVADAGAAAMIWKQGATFADVNNDGWLDLYVCRFDAPNLLYVNQGDGSFREQARSFGLDVSDASTMAAFCDFDRDGRLDVYVQTNLLNNAERPTGQRDYLFRHTEEGRFVDVTAAAGINTGDTQGNAVAWWDFNNDTWPDLYVANDFAAPDRLYRNNGDGTFTEVTDAVLPQVPYSSMGVDSGDINNDGLIDLLATDMAASTHEKDQRSMADTRSRTRDPGDATTAVPNYLRNALFLNTGTAACLEAAYLAGVAATDWTWSVRFEDLDNDGLLDLHVTNGMHREIHNTDLIQRMMTTEGAADRVRAARNSPVLAETNFAFRNRGDLQFENVSAAWGLDQRGVSFASAFGDLDGDGDQDVIFTNYEAPATLLRNTGDTGNRIVVALRGARSNRFGIGAKVRIETVSGVQVRQLWLARGYMASSEPVLHFGLGADEHVKHLHITWPSGHEQAFENLSVNHRYTIHEPAEPVEPREVQPAKPDGSFVEVSAERGLAWRVDEPLIDEIGQQRLLPTRFNRRGPALAVGDLDRDGRQDVVMGGTPLTGARLLFAQPEGRFLLGGTLESGPRAVANDGPILLFDASGDGRLDLLITKGGNSAPAGDREYQPRLWLASDSGLHAAPADALPAIHESIGAAATADFDRDGRLDVFLGGRVTPGLYPIVPRSFLLQQRAGRLVDVTDTLATGLREVGMVTSALWSDVDDDGWVDLLVALEWGPVRYFRNQQGRGLQEETNASGFAAGGSGWWTSLASADFNGDGRLDYAVGNVGLNTPYRAEAQRPVLLWMQEPAEGGALRLVEAYYEGDTMYPRRTRRDLATVLPGLARRFPRNDPFACAPLEQVVGAEFLEEAERLAATELRSGVFLSQPNGTFRFEPLPRLAQVAPAQGMVAGDFDGDGRADLYLVHNSYAPSPVVGRLAGGLSQLLRGNGRGGFEAVPVRETQLVVRGDAKAAVVLDSNDDGWPDLLVSRNRAESLAFENRAPSDRRPLRVSLQGIDGNPTAIGAVVTFAGADGTRQRAEVAAGSGWMSQSSPDVFFSRSNDEGGGTLQIRWPDGRETRHEVPADARQMRIAAD